MELNNVMFMNEKQNIDVLYANRTSVCFDENWRHFAPCALSKTPKYRRNLSGCHQTRWWFQALSMLIITSCALLHVTNPCSQ